MAEQKIKSKISELGSINQLLNVMKRLRDPAGGCPWDLEQDFKSIAPYTIEEAYEVVDAIEHGSMEEFKEELGDLLLQVVFHSQMAAEQDDFTFEDVAQGVADKMVSRHPHVFGDVQVDQAADVNDVWDAQKDKEKGVQDSALDGVALGLPALLRAQKLQKRAARTGFEWKDEDGAFEKLEEEMAELKEAASKNDPAHFEEELGDVLFCIVNYARMKGVNSEEALRKSNDKFNKRFRGLENDLKAENKEIKDANLGQLLDLWNRQKEKEL